MKRWGVRFSDLVPEYIRDACERYGPDVIANVLAGDVEPAAPDLRFAMDNDVAKLYARDWLTERLTIQEYRDRWIPIRDLALEIAVIVLIGWEIRLSYQQETQQSKNFTTQQGVLTTMNTSTGETASAMQSAAGTLHTLSEDQKTANENVQKNLNLTKGMATALQGQLDILKQQQAERKAELSKKPKLELYAGAVGTPEMVSLNSNPPVPAPFRDKTDTSQSFDLHLRNTGTASALNGLLRVVIFAPDVQMQSTSPFQLIADASNLQQHIYTLNFDRLRPGIIIPIAITFIYSKDHAPFVVLFNVDDDESDSGTFLGDLNIVTTK